MLYLARLLTATSASVAFNVAWCHENTDCSSVLNGTDYGHGKCHGSHVSIGMC